MNPRFPLYIVSKGRHETRHTSKALESMRVPYFIIIEEQEFDLYASVIDKSKILVLDQRFKDEFDTFPGVNRKDWPRNEDGSVKSTGSGPARNFAWNHSIESGFSHHWVMDDNIRSFYRLNQNSKIKVSDGTIFHAMEDFVLRYMNVGMAGPNYVFFAKQRQQLRPFIKNTRIYSCNLIRNDLPYRWRCRYNEDTDLSLRMLKDGWCTVLFNAFLQQKLVTQSVKGGNTDEFYAKEGTLVKSKMLVDLHPDCTRLVFKFKRWHHYADYNRFKNNALVKKAGVEISDEINEFGMSLQSIA